MSEHQRRRVVITGIGAVSPCGPTAEDTWDAVRNGRSGVSTVEGFEGHVRIAAQVKDFEPEQYMERRSVRKTDRFAQFAVAAATMAVADADLDVRADGERIGCSIGTGIGGLGTEEVAHRKLFEAGPDRLNPFWVTALIPNMGAAEVSMALGTRGPLTTECTACAASGMSLGNATMYIRASLQPAVLDAIIQKKPKRVIFNPGSESKESERRLREAGIEVVHACTLVLLHTDQFE